MIVAIDGPAGSGKSTTARKAAARVGFQYLDTGAMYRAVTLGFQRAGVIDDASGRARELARMRIDLEMDGRATRVWLDDEDVSEAIRSPSVGAEVSHVAALPEVRMRLVEEQRRLARRFTARGEGVVVDGRDIGTNVFPDADLKIYMVADPDVRARRRRAELARRGIEASHEEVLAEIRARDRIDSMRSVAPLRRALDAIELDTTRMSLTEQTDLVVRLIRERRKGTAV